MRTPYLISCWPPAFSRWVDLSSPIQRCPVYCRARPKPPVWYGLPPTPTGQGWNVDSSAPVVAFRCAIGSQPGARSRSHRLVLWYSSWLSSFSASSGERLLKSSRCRPAFASMCPAAVEQLRHPARRDVGVGLGRAFSRAHDGLETASRPGPNTLRICLLKLGVPISANVKRCSGRGMKSTVAA